MCRHEATDSGTSVSLLTQPTQLNLIHEMSSLFSLSHQSMQQLSKVSLFLSVVPPTLPFYLSLRFFLNLSSSHSPTILPLPFYPLDALLVISPSHSLSVPLISSLSASLSHFFLPLSDSFHSLPLCPPRSLSISSTILNLNFTLSYSLGTHSKMMVFVAHC